MSSDKWSVSVYLLSLSLAAQLMKIEFYAQQCLDSPNGAVAVVFGFIYTCFISLNLDQKRLKTTQKAPTKGTHTLAYVVINEAG